MTLRTQIGFVGLGTMGLPMLENLARSDELELYAYDTADEPFRHLAQHEAWGKRLFRAVDYSDLRGCKTIILMLPNSHITNSVILGNDEREGLIAHLESGAQIIDMGSSDPIETARIAAIIGERGVSLIDAPVSGAVAKARTGELTIMIGASDEEFARLEPLLSLMGSTLIPTGRVAAAHAMKALNNYVYAAGLLAVCEAIIIAERLGLDTRRFTDILNRSSGRNVASETKLEPYILKENYSAGFLLRLQAKDLAIANRLSSDSGVFADQLALCSRLWAEASDVMPDADNTAIHKFVRDAAAQRLHTCSPQH